MARCHFSFLFFLLFPPFSWKTQPPSQTALARSALKVRPPLFSTATLDRRFPVFLFFLLCGYIGAGSCFPPFPFFLISFRLRMIASLSPLPHGRFPPSSFFHKGLLSFFEATGLESRSFPSFFFSRFLFPQFKGLWNPFFPLPPPSSDW